MTNAIREWLARVAGQGQSQQRLDRTAELEVRGLRVVVRNTRPDIATADVICRLDEALGLIERYQPGRFRHLKRDLNHISVIRYPCRGAFDPAQRACITELTFLARRDITAAPVASSILHEGVHARVHCMREHFGFTDGERDRAREERLCRRAELVFGRALPPDLGAPVIERALATLEMADEDVAPLIDPALAQARVQFIDNAARNTSRSQETE